MIAFKFSLTYIKIFLKIIRIQNLCLFFLSRISCCRVFGDLVIFHSIKAAKHTCDLSINYFFRRSCKPTFILYIFWASNRFRENYYCLRSHKSWILLRLFSLQLFCQSYKTVRKELLSRMSQIHYWRLEIFLSITWTLKLYMISTYWKLFTKDI